MFCSNWWAKPKIYTKIQETHSSQNNLEKSEQKWGTHTSQFQKSTCQRINLDYLFTSDNVRAKTINLLEEDLCDFELGIDFLYMAQVITKKEDKLEFIKIITFVFKVCYQESKKNESYNFGFFYSLYCISHKSV